METVKLSPRGYCHGVVNAINTITNLTNLSTEKTITILGMVIHNKQVVEFFEKRGIKTIHSKTKTRLQLLDDIEEGIVVFTAHGVSPEVHRKAESKGLEIIDTTCKDVNISQEIINDYINRGFDIIYIGKQGHPESEAAKGISLNVHLIESFDDLSHLNLVNKNIAITNQTTMSLYDIYQITEEIKQIYPDIVFVDEVCDATRIRQEAVKNQDKSIDHCYVVGDKLSNNSRKLVEVSIKQAGIPATLIENVEDIDIQKLQKYCKVSVTSGASTPTKVTNEVITFLESFNKEDKTTHKNISQINKDNLITLKKSL